MLARHGLDARRRCGRSCAATGWTPRRWPRSGSTSTRCAGESRRRSGPARSAGGRRGRRPFTPAAKKTLELALREALVLGDRHIGPEHILLGALRDASDGIDGLLRRLGTTPETVRAALLAALRAAA